MGLPADLTYARELSERLLQYLPEEATARLVWLGSLPTSALEGFQKEDLDGIGQCFLQSDSHQWDKGLWRCIHWFRSLRWGSVGCRWFHVVDPTQYRQKWWAITNQCGFDDPICWWSFYVLHLCWRQMDSNQQ